MATSESHLSQFAGVQPSQDFVEAVYLNPSMHVTHSVLLMQVAQFLMQASHVFGVAVLRTHPSKQSVHTDLLA